jgi:DNA polymerase III gamma/tau subunit
MNTELIAIRALENASREHTRRAVELLAQHYGFDASEALGKIGILAEEDPAPEAAAPAPSKPSRDDVVARLLRGDDPVPVDSSDEDTSSDTKRAPKPRLTATQKASKKEEARLKKEKKEEAKKAKVAEKAATKVLKAALKALKAFDKDAAKAVKEASKVHKVILKNAKQDANKTMKAAIKAAKAASKAAEKAAKVKSPKAKSAKPAKETSPSSSAPTPEPVPVLEVDAELEEEELQVRRFVVAGVHYLKAEDGELYDEESTDPVGFWCEQTQRIVQERGE